MSMTGAVTDLEIVGIPDAILRALMTWATTGRRAGGFVMAVLENDLVEAYAKADWESTEHLPAIVSFMQSDLPAPCWGSKEKCADWEKEGGIKGWHGDTPRWDLVAKSLHDEKGEPKDAG